MADDAASAQGGLLPAMASDTQDMAGSDTASLLLRMRLESLVNVHARSSPSQGPGMVTGSHSYEGVSKASLADADVSYQWKLHSFISTHRQATRECVGVAWEVLEGPA